MRMSEARRRLSARTARGALVPFTRNRPWWPPSAGSRSGLDSDETSQRFDRPVRLGGRTRMNEPGDEFSQSDFVSGNVFGLENLDVLGYPLEHAQERVLFDPDLNAQ